MCTDIDVASLARYQERIPDAVCVHVSPDDESLPVADRSAQLLLVDEVHQVTESAWFIPEAARVLTPGGMLICSYWRRSLREAAYRTLAGFAALKIATA